MSRRLVLAVGLVLAAAFAGLGWWVVRHRTGGTPPRGDVTVRGLDRPVEILVDSMGVPHVWAASEEDALFAQGWLHARDRLWQMEMFRRVAQGRLSEMFGETSLDSDRFLRTLGMARAAARTWQETNPADRALGEAYARGVNAALDGWKGPMPPEMALLGVDPEPWEPVHSFAVEKIMAWDLTTYGAGLTHARALEAVGEEKYRLLAPGYPEWGVTILGDEVGPGPPGGSAPGATGAGSSSGSVDPALLRAAEPPALAARLLDAGSTVRASNSWVVGGARSASGSPLLANDMHLGLDQPPIWYLMGLHAPGLDVVGMTLPGTPWVVAGHSRAVAWGFTNATVDDGDLFVERLDPDDSTRYLTPRGSEAFRIREEILHVKGREAPLRMTVRETRHGPVMTPVDGRAGDRLLAWSWVAYEASTSAAALRGMNRATSLESFVAALEGFNNPHQNVVMADSAGAFGYWMAGRVPLRRSGRPAVRPVPGWTGEHDWEGWLPFREHPHLLDPQRGFVVTANNRQGWGGTSDLVSAGQWARPYRAQRITELVEAEDAHDAASLHRIQLHVGDAFAARYLPAAVQAFRRAGLDSLAARLGRWSGEATLESRDATLFWSWVEALQARLGKRLYGDGPVLYYPQRSLERELDLGGDGTDSLAVEAARAAADYRDMPWGEAHRLVLRHPLEGVPVLGRLLGFGEGPRPREGSPYSPNVAGFSGREPPFRVTHGPSQRHVVDMADPDGSGGFILPGGQSGYPEGDHSLDQLPNWEGGGLWLLPLAREAVEARAVRRVRLTPAG